MTLVTHPERSTLTDESITDAKAPIQRVVQSIEDHGNKAVTIIALVIASIALGMVFMLPAQQKARIDVLSERAEKAEREARVMQERWNDLKVELARRGIPVSDH